MIIIRPDPTFDVAAKRIEKECVGKYVIFCRKNVSSPESYNFIGGLITEAQIEHSWPQTKITISHLNISFTKYSVRYGSEHLAVVERDMWRGFDSFLHKNHKRLIGALHGPPVYSITLCEGDPAEIVDATKMPRLDVFAECRIITNKKQLFDILL